MGKSKSRSFNLGKSRANSVMKREIVVYRLIEKIKSNGSIREIKDMISLFGITPEELTEGGCSYEQVKALGRIF